ncbi:PA0069 family radical SAM protein [Galbibacter pacificus]|uniref:PA0069 family radical SAM protein n=1 Tax=Galbibacter pacificus TaxID=2996052 RepID=A0ABT6FSY5_9FLAO|nr:PA0069 family radical SAM protein [Galbibacter pacificus]MDG3582717.1 PA0069 family radical SAM protein [Galbibacter pacificus]MDG3586164.1 PA0069 family radical SAM protein [Galbibacter pacificus]
MSDNLKNSKGRGAQINVRNKFLELSHEMREDFLEYCRLEGEIADKNKTSYLEVFPKTIVNKVTSPDVGMGYSMNPYQGCEHGCIYCYARNSHEYWGYSAGLDFERKILVKKNAPQLLEKKLLSRNWQAKTIVMAGNTDCYQPAEQKFRITRKCLEVFLKYKHPVAIITKNAFILRDLDIIKELTSQGLIAVNVSITSLSEDTRRVLEPRTASIKKRLETVKTLSDNMVPVNVMMAPIIPSINSHEILPLAKTVRKHGAISIGFTVVRLNGAIGEIFTDWIHKTLPDKAEKVLHQIAECHGGTLNDSRYGVRKTGEGKIAEQIHALIKIARQQYFSDIQMPQLNKSLFNMQRELFKNSPPGQMNLFE